MKKSICCRLAAVTLTYEIRRGYISIELIINQPNLHICGAALGVLVPGNFYGAAPSLKKEVIHVGLFDPTIVGTDKVTGQSYRLGDSKDGDHRFAQAVEAHPERFWGMSAYEKQQVLDRAHSTGYRSGY